MAKSKKTSNMRRSSTSKWNQNNNTSSHMLLDNCHAFGLSMYIEFLSEKEVP